MLPGLEIDQIHREQFVGLTAGAMNEQRQVDGDATMYRAGRVEHERAGPGRDAAFHVIIGAIDDVDFLA